MTKAATIDQSLYGKGGVTDPAMKRQPLRITEKPFQHRAADDTECHDCGRLIRKGEPFVVSALECTKGMQGKSHRYAVHQACYDIVGRVVLIVGKEACHTFDGRPSLKELWKKHHALIRKTEPGLADMLQGAFG